MELAARQDKTPLLPEPSVRSGLRVSGHVALCAALVAILASATYLPWIKNYLVADSWTVIDAVSTNNLSFADLLPFRESPLRTSATYYYAPVLAAMLWATFKAGGYNPEVYNLVLTGLHAGTALFLFATVLQLTRSLGKATAAGAIFATHFAGTEAAGWFGAITHPTAGFFGTAAMAMYSRYLVSRRRRWWIAALGALIAASFTQSTGLPWIVIIAMLDFAYSWQTEQRGQIALRMAALAAILVVVLPPQTQAFRFAQGGYHYSLGPWLALNLFYYPLSTVAPMLEESAYSLARDLLLASGSWDAFTRLAGMKEAFGLLLGGGLVVVTLILLLSKGSRLTKIAILAFGICLTPFLLLNGQGYRYLYAPLVFFSIATADTIVDGYRFLRGSSWPAAWALMAIVPIFVVVSFAESHRQLFWWQQAGYVAHQSLHQLKELQPGFPSGAKVIFGGLPDTLQNTNAQVWRQGITEAVWAIYSDRTLRVEAYGKQEVERMFREELKGAPDTFGFVYSDWQLRKIAP